VLQVGADVDVAGATGQFSAPRGTASPETMRTVAIYLPWRSPTLAIFAALAGVAIRAASPSMMPPMILIFAPLAMCATGAVVPKTPMSSLPATMAFRPSAEFWNSVRSTSSPSLANRPYSLATKNLAWPVTGK